MENNSIKAFLTYYEQTRSTTLKVIGVIRLKNNTETNLRKTK